MTYEVRSTLVQPLDGGEWTNAKFEAEAGRLAGETWKTTGLIARQRSNGCFTGTELDGTPCCDGCWCTYEAQAGTPVRPNAPARGSNLKEP